MISIINNLMVSLTGVTDPFLLAICTFFSLVLFYGAIVRNLLRLITTKSYLKYSDISFVIVCILWFAKTISYNLMG